MFVKHLIQDILDLQKRIPVTEDKFTKEELEYLPQGELETLRYNYQTIVLHGSNIHQMPSAN